MHLPNFVLSELDDDRELHSFSWNHIERCEGDCRIEQANPLRELSSRTSPEIATLYQTSLKNP
jgi:hypothetical protein